MLKRKSNYIILLRIITLIIFISFSVFVPLTGCTLLKQTDSEDVSNQTGAGESTEETKEQDLPETTSQDTESSEQAAEIAEQEKIISDFDKLIEKNAMPDELIKYIDENLSKTAAPTMAVLLEKLEHVQKAYKEVATQYLFEGDGQQKLLEAFDSEEVLVEDNIDKITDENFKSDILKIINGGYRFINLEGLYYPIIDFEYLKKYSDYIDKEYNDYINIRAEESNKVYARDAALILSWDELAARMINAEKYLTLYGKETPRKIEVGNLLLLYFASYLYGQNNTPTRDSTTNTVLEEVIESYTNTISKNPDSETVKIIEGYLAELESNDYLFNDDIFDSISKHINELIKTYELDSTYMISEQLKYLSYPSENTAKGYIQLIDGKYTETYEDDSETVLSIKLTEFIAIGDLDGNGINDGAAILMEEPGGSGTFYYLHAINNGGFYIYSIASTFLSDRVKIEDIKIEDGKIYIDMVVHKEDDPMCCPTEEVTKIFELKDSYLEEL